MQNAEENPTGTLSATQASNAIEIAVAVTTGIVRQQQK